MWRDERIDTYRDSRDYSNLLGSKAETEYEPSKSRQDFLRRREAIQGILKSKEKPRISDPGPSKRPQTTKEPKRELPFDKNFGSFFGPSEPIVVKRVLEEDRNRHEARLLASKMAKQANQAKQKQVSSSTNTVAKQKPVKSLTKTEMKIQKLKEARDYSFLFSENDDDAVPQSKPSASSSPMRSSRPSSSGASARPSSNNRKPSGTASRHAQSTPPSRPASKTPVSTSRPSNNLPRPKPNDVSKKPVTTTRPVSASQTRPAQQVPSKPKAGTQYSDRAKASDPSRKAPAARPSNESARQGGSVRPSQSNWSVRPNQSNGSVRPSHSNGSVRPSHSNGSVRPSHSNGSVRPSHSNGSSRPSHLNGSVRPEPGARAVPSSNGSARPAPIKQKSLPAKRSRTPSDDEEEDVDYRRFLPKQFRVDYKRGYDDDGYDSSDMEADFHTIQAEEARSMRIARQEDEEELAKIQEEERLENLRKKRRKN